jgi:hypothetical protein
MSLEQQKLDRWFNVSQQLEALKAEELELRKELFAAAFEDPKEGTKENKFSLADGWILQGDYKINRNVDAAVVSTLSTMDNMQALIARVFTYKPSLNLAEWKKLDHDDRVALADAVTEKPGTPALKIVRPKR